MSDDNDCDYDHNNNIHSLVPIMCQFAAIITSIHSTSTRTCFLMERFVSCQHPLSFIVSYVARLCFTETTACQSQPYSLDDADHPGIGHSQNINLDLGCHIGSETESNPVKDTGREPFEGFSGN
jgi:hypothetical protein